MLIWSESDEKDDLSNMATKIEETDSAMVEDLQYSGFNSNSEDKTPEFDDFETNGIPKWVKN